MQQLSYNINNFFKYFNHEIKNIQFVDIDSKDEFATISKLIKDNVIKSKKAFELDDSAINAVVDAVGQIDKGNLAVRINADAINPQLKHLLNVLNAMLNSLEQKIGSNLDNLLSLLKSYQSLDFTKEISQAKANAELAINSLGQEMRNNLLASKDYANNLSEQTDNLNESMQRLLSSSDLQHKSIQRSVTSIEQIAFSM